MYIVVTTYPDEEPFAAGPFPTREQADYYRDCLEAQHDSDLCTFEAYVCELSAYAGDANGH